MIGGFERVERPYVVRGRWPFPTDMLRHYGSRPATEADRLAIERLSRDHVESREELLRDEEVSLVGPRDPNAARWESFGWEVPGDPIRAAARSDRERRDRESSLLRSALAKLDPDERELVERLASLRP